MLLVAEGSKNSHNIGPCNWAALLILFCNRLAVIVTIIVTVNSTINTQCK